MKKKTVAVFVLIIIIIFSFVSVFLNKPTGEQPPKVSGGYLDLSAWSFEKSGIVSLEGTWSFYFNQFLSHEDFQKGVNAVPIPVEVPSTKKSMTSSKPFEENKYYGTMRLVVKLPDRSATYGLKTDIVLTSYKLYIDGRPYGEVGKVGPSGQSSVPFYNVLTAYFNPHNNEVELIYHTSDFVSGDNAITPPKIGLAYQIAREERLNLGRDLFLFGMLFIMGLYHIGLFMMRPKDRAPFYFAVFCLLFSIRMLLIGERFLPNCISLNFLIYGRMAYICVFVGFSALCGFLYYTLEGLFHKWFVQVGVTIGLLFGLLVLLVPYDADDELLLLYAVFGFSFLGYAILRLVTGVLRSRPFTITVLFGFIILGITFTNDFIYQITLSNTPSLIPLGVTVFTFTQAYTLSARFSNAFTQAEKLSAENAEILQELKLMNSNLESLVEDRTADLQKALEEMDDMSKTDYLTKLPNRRLLLTEIDQLIKERKEFYIGLADIDYFKDINDTFGHLKGDEILIQISEMLHGMVSGCGFVGRWGGEEFLIVLETDAVGTISGKAEEIRAELEKYWYDDIGKHITITIGLCRYSENVSVNAVIAKADKCLYQGKAEGRNKCVISETMESIGVL
jgi:diguanylate cyclase (GGDEF) domain